MKLYHVSYIFNRESILNEGLKPNSYNSDNIQYTNRICFSNDRNKAGFDYVDFDNVDVYEVTIPDDLIHLIKSDNYIPNLKRYVCMDFPDETYRLKDLKIVETVCNGEIILY